MHIPSSSTEFNMVTVRYLGFVWKSRGTTQEGPFVVASLLFHAGQAAIKLPSAEASKRAQCTSPEQYAPYIKGIIIKLLRVKYQLRKL